MSCRGCDKQALKDAAMRKSIEDAQAERKAKEVQVHPGRLAITCGCGLMRLLPSGLKEGESFTLVPCLKCGQSLQGQFVGNGVQEII